MENVGGDSSLLVVVVVLLLLVTPTSLATSELVDLHPVMPAKQLCDKSEHSKRDPPGHGSHTLRAFDADTPQ
jgi:hypothetical protein